MCGATYCWISLPQPHCSCMNSSWHVARNKTYQALPLEFQRCALANKSPHRAHAYLGKMPPDRAMQSCTLPAIDRTSFSDPEYIRAALRSFLLKPANLSDFCSMFFICFLRAGHMCSAGFRSGERDGHPGRAFNPHFRISLLGNYSPTIAPGVGHS